jgi:CRISPR system Cascade subunit CasB
MITDLPQRPRIGAAAVRWWEALQTPAQRGDRAALARCNTTIDVRFQPAWHELAQQVGGAGGLSPYDQRQLAVVGAVLAHVRTQSALSIAEAMGSGDKPAVSDLRFRKLLAADPEELRVGMIRAVHLLGRTANVGALAESLFTWGDGRRLSWAEEYYRVAPKPSAKN